MEQRRHRTPSRGLAALLVALATSLALLGGAPAATARAASGPTASQAAAARSASSSASNHRDRAHHDAVRTSVHRGSPQADRLLSDVPPLPVAAPDPPAVVGVASRSARRAPPAYAVPGDALGRGPPS